MHRQSARQRITYIIPHHDEDRLSNSTVGKPIKNHLDGSHNIGHLLGINALALHVVPINASSSTASSGSDQSELYDVYVYHWH
jgi:predicted Zn-dependent protease